ncbi:flagellar capping protein [Herbaspirillum sp. CF444]|uniref:flagellar filament capping protein FliD n=1 Tax=Herbaspirillum sp. CF444 TaxID=1144319 RepID=UPI000272465F|nr:flagellar filament capping protein FliD [Herbaspirillum sp. CF444]EJL84982.1 flagellar capping protein [Herbaspirillum sp. CF444]
MAISSGTISTAAGPLDVPGLVAKLMAAEKVALDPLARQARSYNSLVSAYGSLKSIVSTYQAELNRLAPASFSALKAAVANRGTGTTLTTEPFTADVNSDESTKVLAQKIQSVGFPKSQIFNAGDSLAIKVGSNPPVFITLKADATLAGVRDAINAGKTGVTASIASDGTGDHLVLESNTAGTANTIRIQANNTLSGLNYDPSRSIPSTMSQIQAPRDATVAAAGSYTIAVSQLAQAQKITSAGFPANAAFDGGILAIKTGNGSTAIIKPVTNTLAGVRDAINSSNAGVSASIVNDGTSSHLVMTAKESGKTNSIRVTGTGSYASLSFDPSGKYTSAGVPPGQTFDAGTGALTLKVGGTTTSIPLNGAGRTLQHVRDAINTANAGVMASIANDGAADHLVLTPSGGSATSPVALMGTGDFSSLGGSMMGQLAAAQDARLSIDGVAVDSASNKVANAIAGVTLNLSKVTTASDNFALTVSHDTSAITTSATTFVSAYNALVKAVKGLTLQTPSRTPGQAGTSSPLAADSSTRNLITQLRSILLGKVDGGNGINSLSDVGISFQKDGTLALDSAKLNAAVKNNLAGVENLFASAATVTAGIAGNTKTAASGAGGILVKLQKLLNGALGDGGVIDVRTKGMQASLKINTDRQTIVQNRLNSLEDQYTKRFNHLNRTLSSMTATQNYLTQQLSRLSRASN